MREISGVIDTFVKLLGYAGTFILTFLRQRTCPPVLFKNSAEVQVAEMVGAYVTVNGAVRGHTSRFLSSGDKPFGESFPGKDA